MPCKKITGIYMIKCKINNTVDKILKSGQPYNPRRGNVKHLKGIKIIKVEEGLF